MNTYYPLFAFVSVILALVAVLVYTRSFRKYMSTFKTTYPEMYNKTVNKLGVFNAPQKIVFLLNKMYFFGDSRMKDPNYEKRRKFSKNSFLFLTTILILAFIFGSLSA